MIIMLFQQLAIALPSTLAVPIILVKVFCIPPDKTLQSSLMGNYVLLCGVSSLIQTSYGCRYVQYAAYMRVWIQVFLKICNLKNLC